MKLIHRVKAGEEAELLDTAVDPPRLTRRQNRLYRRDLGRDGDVRRPSSAARRPSTKNEVKEILSECGLGERGGEDVLTTSEGAAGLLVRPSLARTLRVLKSIGMMTGCVDKTAARRAPLPKGGRCRRSCKQGAHATDAFDVPVPFRAACSGRARLDWSGS